MGKTPPLKSATIEIDIHKKNIEQVVKPLITHTTSFTYVDSHGDIIRKNILDGCHIVEIGLSDASFEQNEKLAMFNVDTLNISNENATRKTKAIVNDNMTELCEVSLGYWRNLISKIDGIEKLVIGVRTYYDKTTGLRKEKDGLNTNYATMIMTDNSNIEAATNMLKDIFKKNPKIVATWQ